MLLLSPLECFLPQKKRESSINAKETYISTKMPYISAKFPMFLWEYVTAAAVSSRKNGRAASRHKKPTFPENYRIFPPNSPYFWGEEDRGYHANHKGRSAVFVVHPLRVLQCVAVCCSALQCVAVRCSVLQCVAVCCIVLQCVAVCCSVLQCVAVCCSVLQCQRRSAVYMISPDSA